MQLMPSYIAYNIGSESESIVPSTKASKWKSPVYQGRMFDVQFVILFLLIGYMLSF